MQQHRDHPEVNQVTESVMTAMFNRFVKCESGATAIEYGLIASLIGVAIIGALTTTGTKLAGTFSKVEAQLNK
jgi:pilus assembly protein Flp/PilA